MADTISDNIFEMISDPVGINISTGINPRIFNKVLVQDSLLNFFPYSEVFLSDKQGIIVSAYTFIEGMKFATKFGCPETTLADGTTKIGGYLIHDYAWSEDQITATVKDSDYLSGVNCFILLSNCFFKDYVSTKAYKQQPSAIAKNIAQQIFGINDSSKLFIDTTDNDLTNIWYQGNRTNKEFISETLAKNAYSTAIQNGDKVPFVSFINCNGEFYFCSYATLYAQTPVATYEQSLSMDRVTDPFAIQSIIFATGGAPANKKHYKIAAYSLDDKGATVKEDIALQDKYLKINPSTGSNLGKYPINISNTKQTSSVINFGLFEKNDAHLRSARETFLYEDSCMAFRIDITIKFNPKVVAGKTINIKIKKSTENDQYATELSGKWLVMATQHLMGINNFISSHITLCRPSIPFDNSWKYSANILS